MRFRGNAIGKGLKGHSINITVDKSVYMTVKFYKSRQSLYIAPDGDLLQIKPMVQNDVKILYNEPYFSLASC